MCFPAPLPLSSTANAFYGMPATARSRPPVITNCLLPSMTYLNSMYGATRVSFHLNPASALIP